MKICLVGEGAFANKHLDAIERIDDVEVISICGGVQETTDKVAAERGISHVTLDLAESLAQPGLEAAILATPTPMPFRSSGQTLPDSARPRPGPA